jgi:hypothetical protein
MVQMIFGPICLSNTTTEWNYSTKSGAVDNLDATRAPDVARALRLVQVPSSKIADAIQIQIQIQLIIRLL